MSAGAWRTRRCAARHRRSPRPRPLSIEDGPGLAIADGGERRQRRAVSLAKRAAPPPPAPHRTGSRARRDPPAVLGRRRRARGRARRPRIPARRGQRPVALELAISSARTTRRGLCRSVRGGEGRRSRGQPSGQRRRRRRARARPRGRPERRRPTAARPCRGRVATARSQNPVPPARIPTPPRRPRSASASSGVCPEVGDAERLVGVDEVEAVVDDPAPLPGGRLRGADVEAAIDLPRVGGDRSRPGDPRRAAIPRARSPGRSCRSPSAPPITTSGGTASGDDGPRSAYGPRVLDADVDQPPDEVAATRATWTSLFSRERPVRCATPSGRCANASRDSAVPGGLLVVVVVAARRDHGVDEHLGRPARPMPGSARARSPPGAPAAR